MLEGTPARFLAIGGDLFDGHAIIPVSDVHVSVFVRIILFVLMLSARRGLNLSFLR